ncbi:uncharacterized protein LOC113272312 [Papaver somniferum]|uniref:uncharacterized protein LOC113272312 n=1 Tax=Papaver somniferum TaxID=3469 RepID=UPI000E6F623E|nr:uncharacterized protein LOC113272312 [Papaver somniferum]
MSEQVIQAKDKMDTAQVLFQSHPLGSDMARRERQYVVEYVKLAKYEEFVAKKQSRIKWLDLGYSNTSIFHNSLKLRRSKNNILSLYTSENVKLEEDQDIAKECITYYSDLFGSDLNEEDNSTSLSRLRIDAYIQQDDVVDLIKPVTREEVVVALHSIGSSKAPGPDGPISCCNVIYKCIPKILSLRMKKILGGIITQTQSAFISGRSIQHNIMVAHELQLGFPEVFITWISLCIKTAKFSILINGPPYAFFGAKRGLRQGSTAAASSLKIALDDFSVCTGLQINNQKTSLYCFVVPDVILQQIVQVLNCSVGELSVRYLGVSLLSTKLSYRDCLPLLERVDERIYSWKSISLAYPWRALPIKAVLSGGLGIKDLLNTNTAVNLKQDPVSSKEIIWTHWVKSNLIKSKDFWTISIPQDSSWYWRRILEHREIAKNHIEVLLDESKVAAFISNGHWYFPDFMEEEIQEVVQQISLSDFNSLEKDQIYWNSSTISQFSIKATYIAISDHLPKPFWNNLVWFKKHIPRHSFITWLALHKRLKTRSKLFKWGVTSDASYILCGHVEETENHLFHDCISSAGIWSGLLLKMGIIKDPTVNWDNEIRWNNRVFRALYGSQDQVNTLIIQDVRFKMMASIQEESDNPNARSFMMRWNVECIFVLPEFISCTWLYPDEDEVMINTDGAKSDSTGGFGAITRDHTAEVIGATSGESPIISVLVHELQGVEMGFIACYTEKSVQSPSYY